MKKLYITYNTERKRVTFYLDTITGKHRKHKELTDKELIKLCDTIQTRIIWKKIGTTLPNYFGFSYWSDF